jgi:hypothetical protein
MDIIRPQNIQGKTQPHTRLAKRTTSISMFECCLDASQSSDSRTIIAESKSPHCLSLPEFFCLLYVCVCVCVCVRVKLPLTHVPNPKGDYLWLGMGIRYSRTGDCVG